MVMLSGALAVAGGVSESATCTVKFEVPAVVGVPEITPVLGFRPKPGGKGPLVMLSGPVAVAGGNWESATCTVKLEMPAPLGVPVIAPLFAFKCKPTGKL